MSVVNIPTSASGYHQSIVSQAASAQRVVNRMQMSPKLNPNGFIQPLGRITNSASEFQKSMDASAARVFAFGAAVGVINGISDAFASVVSSAVEVEKALKDVQVVMEATDQEMRKFGRGIFDVAKNTAQSFETVSQSAIELARQGLGAEETLARVNSALILSRLSGLSAVKSTETLTAAINSFNKEGITHEQIINRMANVDAAFAVSSSDLAEAISRAGAVAQSSGVSFNELAAIVTAVQQRTARGGSVIGNGFKSIFTRIKRSGVRDALEEIGVATKNNDGSFRSSISILKDYANIYKTLSDAQKAYTSEQIAGVFQIQNLQALIQDLNDDVSIYNKALGVANNTTNQATMRNEELNKTLSALFSQASSEVKEFAARLGELGLSGSFKNIIKAVGSLAEFLNDLLDEEKGSSLAKSFVKGFGSFLTGPGLVILGAAFLKIFKLVSGFAVTAFADMMGINKEAKRQQGLQAAIGQALANNNGLYQKILAAGSNTAKQEAIILNLIKQETAERLKQESIVRRLASSGALYGIGAKETGYTAVGGKFSRSRSMGNKALGLSGGFLPSMMQEQRDINMGIGGARKGDRPVVLRNHKMGSGKTQNVVAHTGEWMVPNFAGTGGDAIFNRSMVKSFGLPKGARKITASSGFVPNYSRGKSISATSLELGFKEGGNSLISKKSDYFDSFSSTINLIKNSLGTKQIGTAAQKDYQKILKPVFFDDNNNIIKNPTKDQKEVLSRRYQLSKKEYRKFLKKGVDGVTYGELMKSSPYNGFKTGIRNLLSMSYKGRKQPIEIEKQFSSLTNITKGARGEIEGVKTLKALGYTNIKPIAKSGSFDKQAISPSGKKVLAEDKSGKFVNKYGILKKGATQYLGTLPGEGLKDQKKDHINLNAVKAGRSLMFPGGLNLISASDTKIGANKITHEKYAKESKGRKEYLKMAKNSFKEDTGLEHVSTPDLKKLTEVLKNYSSFASGYIPNFAKAGVQTSLGFVSTQRINRLKDGQSANIGGGKVYLDKFSVEDQAKIKSFEAENSKQKIAIAAESRKKARNEMPTIDASRQATMLVATNNFRKKIDSNYKHGDKTYRLKYRVEGLKPSKLKNTEKNIRSRIEDLMIQESSGLARTLSGTGQFAANNPIIKKLSNAGSAGSAAGSIFETALQAIGKNKLFTSNNAGFDIAGMPDARLQKLFGYYTPFADAKIGLTSDTKRDFHQKLMNLQGQTRKISGKERKAQGKMALDTRKKYGAPQRASVGFVPNFGRFNLFEGVRTTKGGKDYIWENELAQAKHQLPEGTKFTPWAKNPKMLFVSGHKNRNQMTKDKISFESSEDLRMFGKFAANEGYPEVMAAIVKASSVKERSKILTGNARTQRVYDRKAGKNQIEKIPNEISIEDIKKMGISDFKNFELGRIGAKLEDLYTARSFDKVENEKFIQKPIGQKEYMPLGGATEPKMADVYDSRENIFKNIQKTRGKDFVEDATIQDLYKRFSEEQKLKSNYNYSKGFIPNFMAWGLTRRSGFGKDGSVFERSEGKKRVLHVSHIRSGSGEFGSSIYKRLLQEIQDAAKKGKPYTKIDAGSIVGPRIPRALLAAKKVLDKKRLKQNIPKMQLEGMFIPKQLRARVEKFRQDNYFSKDGKFQTKDSSEYLPGEERKLIKSLRSFGLGRNAHKQKGFVNLEDLPMGKSFSTGFVPNFSKVNMNWGKLKSGEKMLSIPETLSSLRYSKQSGKTTAIDFISSMRKGDGSKLFEALLKKEKALKSTHLSPVRVWKQNSKTNFEDLMYAFPQLQYRLKKGMETTGRINLGGGKTFRFQSLKDLKEVVNKNFKRDEFQGLIEGKSVQVGSGTIRQNRLAVEDLTTVFNKNRVGDDIYKKYSKGFIPNFARPGRKFKRFKKDKFLRDIGKRRESNKRSNEESYIWAADKSLKLQKISKQLHLDKIDDVFQGLGFFSKGFIPNFADQVNISKALEDMFKRYGNSLFKDGKFPGQHFGAIDKNSFKKLDKIHQQMSVSKILKPAEAVKLQHRMFKYDDEKYRGQTGKYIDPSADNFKKLSSLEMAALGMSAKRMSELLNQRASSTEGKKIVESDRLKLKELIKKEQADLNNLRVYGTRVGGEDILMQDKGVRKVSIGSESPHRQLRFPDVIQQRKDQLRASMKRGGHLRNSLSPVSTTSMLDRSINQVKYLEIEQSQKRLAQLKYEMALISGKGHLDTVRAIKKIPSDIYSSGEKRKSLKKLLDLDSHLVRNSKTDGISQQSRVDRAKYLNSLIEEIEENKKNKFLYRNTYGRLESIRSGVSDIYSGAKEKSRSLTPKLRRFGRFFVRGSTGFIPSLKESFAREKKSLKQRGLSSKGIRLEQSDKLKNQKNPEGFAITNIWDEPLGVNQGILRSERMGIDPKKHGAINSSKGFIPNYRLSALRRSPKPAKKPKKDMTPEELAQAKAASQQAWMTRGIVASMAAPMIADQISRGDKYNTSIIGNASAQALQFGSYGLMFGGKGGLIGAGLGGIYGAVDAGRNTTSKSALKDMASSMRDQQQKLLEETKNIESLRDYAEGIRSLNDAIASGDRDSIRNHRKQLEQGLRGITDDTVLNALKNTSDGAEGLRDKMLILDEALEKSTRQAESMKTVLEATSAVFAAIENNQPDWGDMFASYFTDIDPKVDLSESRNLARKMRPIVDSSRQMDVDAKLRSQYKDYSNNLKEGDQKMSYQEFSDEKRGGLQIKLIKDTITELEKDVNKFERFSELFEKAMAEEFSDDELKAKNYRKRLIKPADPVIFQGDVKNVFGGDGIDGKGGLIANQRAVASMMLGDKKILDLFSERGNLGDFLKYVSLASGTKITELNEKDYNDKNIEYDSKIKTGGYFLGIDDGDDGQSINVDMVREYFKIFTELLSDLRKKANALEAGEKDINTSLTAVYNIDEELKKAIRNAQSLTRNLELFSKIFEQSQKAWGQYIENATSERMGKNQDLFSVGALSREEFTERRFRIERANAIDQNTLNQESAIMQILSKRFDPDSTYDLKEMQRMAKTVVSENKGGHIRKITQDIADEDRPGRSNFTNLLNDFMSRMRAGTDEGGISGFLQSLNANSKLTNEILEEIAISNMGIQNDLEARMEAIRVQENQQIRAQAIDVIAKNASSLISNEDQSNILELFKLGGAKSSRGLSQFGIEQASSISNADRDSFRKMDLARQSMAQASLEKRFGVSLASQTGRDGLQNKRNIFDFNKGILKDLGGGLPGMDRIISNIENAFDIMENTRDEQNAKFKQLDLTHLGYGTDNEKMVGLQLKYLPELKTISSGIQTIASNYTLKTNVSPASIDQNVVKNTLATQGQAVSPENENFLSKVFDDFTSRIESSNQALAAGNNLLSEALAVIPNQIKNEISNAVFHHAINGNVKIDFNTEELKQALGSELSSKLEEIFASGTTAMVVAKAVQGLIEIKPNQIKN